MSRFFIEFSYDGSSYHGLQKQSNSFTIQECIESNISKYLGLECNLTLAGRTDTGVHAKQMFAHFDIQKDFNQNNFCNSLNMMLPKDICIESLSLVNDESHARFDANNRTYIYFINSKKNPFNYKFSYYLKDKLDINEMNKSCELLTKHKDFKCFSKSNTDVKTYNCDITYAKWDIISEGYQFKITANRFLRNMVRSIVGTMIEIGRLKITEKDFQDILNSRDRGKAGFSVPSSGLFLKNISYNEIFKKNWKK
ncbi:MAG: tRNA pseudouridine(38-40) synthase TruA [Flavobacteriales bacterium]|nr:MAG: tRNA pseudouridine(38-40) synthase TruA [Flavobacteriales bacterium]|tara:strand:- start:159 stop:917 length:759 start_codon:yes stop_codon:yes gene_type:complete